MTIEPPAARPSTNIDIEGLYAECLPRVYAFALRMLGDREAALDVAQDSFAVALARADSFDVAKMAEVGLWAQTWAVTDLEPQLLEKIFIRPFSSLQAALDAAREEKGKDAKVLVLLDGSLTIPYVSQ